MTLFDKTARGREEIANRGRSLAPRLRTLLLLVDGKTGSDILLGKVSGLGLAEEHLQELLEAGLIKGLDEPIAARTADIGTTTALEQLSNVGLAIPDITTPPPAQYDQSILPPGQTQFEAIYRFYNETI